MDDLISRKALIAEYDRVHIGPPGGARKLMEDAPAALRWIPVAEGLPTLIPRSTGTAYSDAVNVLTTGRKVLTALWNGTDFITYAEYCEAEGEEITHWAPVLLPLPPKEG